MLWGIKFENINGNQILATRNIDHPHCTVWPGFKFKETLVLPNERIVGFRSRIDKGRLFDFEI